VTGQREVTELRLAVTAADYDQALAFYRDALGLPERATYTAAGGRVTILEAGRATLEIADPAYAAYIDEVEIGQRVAGHIRVAFEVADSATATDRLAAAGATVIANPVRTPWQSLNARLEGPAGLQLTLFSDEPDPAAPPRDALPATRDPGQQPSLGAHGDAPDCA
jgi:predicted enzyme related to lactoylglutathione lyase